MAYCTYMFFFFNNTATTDIYTLSLHDALPILYLQKQKMDKENADFTVVVDKLPARAGIDPLNKLIDRKPDDNVIKVDRKSTRLNSSHANISYAVFCLKKKKKKTSQR